MMPCCPFCSLKYIKSDGKMINERYFQALVKAYPYNDNIDKWKDPTKRCKCDCHVVGKNVLH